MYVINEINNFKYVIDSSPIITRFSTANRRIKVIKICSPLKKRHVPPPKLNPLEPNSWTFSNIRRDARTHEYIEQEARALSLIRRKCFTLAARLP